MTKKSILKAVDRDLANPFSCAVAMLCGREPPAFLAGIYFSEELTDKQFNDLQSWILNDKTTELMTGCGAIDAADALVNAAIECGIIEPRLVDRKNCCDGCGASFVEPLIYTGYGKKEMRRCATCLPQYMRDALPSHWRHVTAETSNVI